MLCVTFLTSDRVEAKQTKYGAELTLHREDATIEHILTWYEKQNHAQGTGSGT